MTLGLVLFYCGVLLYCARTRLDVFSLGYLAMSATLAIQQAIFAARFTKSYVIREVFYAKQIDPGFSRWAACLGLAEVAALLDYAEWHLVPALDQPLMKAVGAVLFALTIAWLFYVDSFLYRSFEPAHERRELMTVGPYRFVRHPRYTGLLFTRLAFPLMLASVVAWCLCLLWIVVILRRIHKEETYLRKRFGPKYDSYAARTPRLIPMFGQAARAAVRLGLIAVALSAGAAGVELKKETSDAFERYVRQAESSFETRIGHDAGFVFGTMPERRASLRAGRVLTEPVIKPRGELKVPSGLIHDWVGAVFIPNVSVKNVIELVQSYDRHKEFYRPEVIGSRLLARDGEDFRVSLRLLKKKVLTVVLDTEHAVHYERLGETRWWSRSRSTRIAEVQDPGTPKERALPQGTGRGFLWRLNSYWTFQELDGGTYVECEAISLTRDVPRGLRLVIEQIIRTLPSESLANTLRNTRTAASRLEGN